jgi:siroheme synthase (precorrin-2 oxidase/ferrochelatase)
VNTAMVRKITLILLVNLCLAASALSYDVVYVINLDSCSERLKKMEKQLNRFGIKFRRFRAVNGYRIKIVNAKTGQIEDNRSFHKTCDKNGEYLVSCEQVSFKYFPARGSRILCCGE